MEKSLLTVAEMVINTEKFEDFMEDEVRLAFQDSFTKPVWSGWHFDISINWKGELSLSSALSQGTQSMESWNGDELILTSVPAYQEFERENLITTDMVQEESAETIDVLYDYIWREYLPEKDYEIDKNIQLEKILETIEEEKIDPIDIYEEAGLEELLEEYKDDYACNEWDNWGREGIIENIRHNLDDIRFQIENLNSIEKN